MKNVEGLLTVLREAEAAHYDQPISPAADLRIRAALAPPRWSKDAGWLAVVGAMAVALLLAVQTGGSAPRPRPALSLSTEDAGALSLDLGLADATAAAAAAQANEHSGGPRALP